MDYFKNVELANMYKVSPNTIGNWIESAKEHRLNLQLHDKGSKSYILNNAHNHNVLTNLSKQGKKFKNTRSLKTIEPTKEFYATYDEKQIIDIINNLETNKETDLKYTYFNEGAKIWDNYIKRILDENGDTFTIKSTIQLLEANAYYLNSLAKKYKNINIIDIGPGNGAPVKNLIQFFINNGKLKKYIALDYSPKILEIVKNNMSLWYGDKINMESYIVDVNQETFRDILFKSSYTKDSNDNECINLIVFVGSTIENQRLYFQSLSTIKNSMGQSDILILGHRLDSPNAKLEVNFKSPDPKVKNGDLLNSDLVLKLLNITENMYELEKVYSEAEKARLFMANLNYDIEIVFNTSNFTKTLYLNQHDKIIFFRHGHHTLPSVINTLSDAGFNVLHATTSLIYEQILVISNLKSMDPTSSIKS